MIIKVREKSGLVRIDFRDSVGNNCLMSVYVPMGTDEPKLRFGVATSFDGDYSTPMCLTRDDVALLLPILKGFIKDGKLPYYTDQD